VKKSTKIVAVVVVVVLLGVAGYITYEFYFAPISPDSCIPYLRTNCGGGGNAISFNTSTGDITVPSVSQSYGVTYYNVAVAYASADQQGNPTNGYSHNYGPKGTYFQSDTSDIPGNTLSSGQTVTLNNINATGPVQSGNTYYGALYLAYTNSTSGGPCTGLAGANPNCQYTEIGTITLVS
jgi:hypothetical protein